MSKHMDGHLHTYLKTHMHTCTHHADHLRASWEWKKRLLGKHGEHTENDLFKFMTTSNEYFENFCTLSLGWELITRMDSSCWVWVESKPGGEGSSPVHSFPNVDSSRQKQQEGSFAQELTNHTTHPQVPSVCPSYAAVSKNESLYVWHLNKACQLRGR